MIHNPDLEGDTFYWKAGTVGVLLIHGFTATTAEVRPLAARLHQAGYTVFGPLLPGHFTKPEDLNRTSWQDWAETVEESFQQLHLDCDRVIVGGESTGALLSMLLAIQHPEIAALILYAPALRLNQKPFMLTFMQLISPIVPWIPKRKMDDGLPWQGYRVRPLKGINQLINLQRVVASDIDRIQQPTLIVQGKLDRTVHPDVPQQIMDGINSTFKETQWMPASTHCVIIDHELDQVVEITLSFIQRALGYQS